MKLPKIKKLPSGSWHAQLQIDGERYSITGNTKEAVRQKMKDVIGGAEATKMSPLTVGDAIDNYIRYKEKRLSPSTILQYQKCRRRYFQGIMGVNLGRITSEMIQDAVDLEDELGYSPKTIKNAYSLLRSTLKRYRPKFYPEVELPENRREEILIPSEEEVRKLWVYFRGTDTELPFLLAVWLGLRMSEIAGLKFGDVESGRVHIQRARLQGPNGMVVKGTKTYSGDRWITCPDYILTLIANQPHNEPGEFVIRGHRGTINKHFHAGCEKLGIRAYRMHDLRHFAASEALALNIPDKYQMKRMGHKTDDMLKRVYQHTLKEKEDSFAKILDKHMLEIFNETTA